MTGWIKLLDEKPREKDIYLCLCLTYGKKWDERFLKWTEEGFQPLDYGENGAWAINMNVTHWLKVKSIKPPIIEAETLIIETEIFYEDINLTSFVESNNIETFFKHANAREFIISNVSDATLREMRNKFKSAGTHFNVRSF